MKETLYYPCTRNSKTGKISQKLVDRPMTKDAWLNLDAIPQPVGHNYFKEGS